ncbi:MAG TPA: signal peptidase I [Rhizomicrobium sp.]|nr:signal peptidase I [Rhizomicrobium sp.]
MTAIRGWRRFKARIALGWRRTLPASARRRIALAWNWSKEPLVTVAVILAATTAVARPYYVPSGSMEPTLQIGDEFIASKFAYGYSRYSLPFGLGPESDRRLFGAAPRRGDIVAFQLPSDPSKTLVKRVVGVPGDRIQMIAGRLWIDGAPVKLRAAGTGVVEDDMGDKMSVPRFAETLPGGVTHYILKWMQDGQYDDTRVFTVPPGHYFMMGDDRDNSLDSRADPSIGGVGFVPAENLVGRAEFVLGSVDYKAADGIWSWPLHVRGSRFLKSVR